MHKIQLTFNTQNVNISVALKALEAYRAGKYTEAIAGLVEVLDMEPQNWDARLMLGASYYKSGQYFAAQCAFRLVCERAPEQDIRIKGREGLLAASARTGKGLQIPEEFGTCAGRKDLTVSWLDY